MLLAGNRIVMDDFRGLVNHRVSRNGRNKQSIRRQENPWFQCLKLKLLLLPRIPFQNSYLSSNRDFSSLIFPQQVSTNF